MSASEFFSTLSPLQVVMWLVLNCAWQADSFPSGAPLSACSHLMPVHMDGELQEVASPYVLVVNSTTYSTKPLKCEHTRFSLANLQHTRFSLANLQHTHFSLANLQHTRFSLANLQHTHFSLANLQHTRFSLANLQHTHFSLANLQHQAPQM